MAATKGQFEVKREARIQAPPSKVFDLLNDFHRWRDSQGHTHSAEVVGGLRAAKKKSYQQRKLRTLPRVGGAREFRCIN